MADDCGFGVQVREVKQKLLRKAADRLRLQDNFKKQREEAAGFRQSNPWVEDSALFYALSHYEEELIDKAWWFWPEPIRWSFKISSGIAISQLTNTSPCINDCTSKRIGRHFLLASCLTRRLLGMYAGSGRRRQWQRRRRNSRMRSSASLSSSISSTSSGRLSG